MQIFGEEPLLWRTDAPIGQGYKLIRGRDVRLDNINDYLRLASENYEVLFTGIKIHPYEFTPDTKYKYYLVNLSTFDGASESVVEHYDTIAAGNNCDYELISSTTRNKNGTT